MSYSSGATTTTTAAAAANYADEMTAAGAGAPSSSAPATPTTPSTAAAAAVVDERASEDALDDVHTRFILNLPPEELASSDRIFFQLEQAYWFYDDFHCDGAERRGGPPLRRYPSLRPFARRVFKMSPVLGEPSSSMVSGSGSSKSFDEMWDEFCAYKRRISTYGTIMLNADCTRLVLCKSFFGEAWTFPAGKVNYGETGVEAGARETYEETGFDPLCNFGLAKTMKEEADASDNKNTKLGWSPIRDEDALVYSEENSGKRRTCYVCRGVPEDFPFAPVARKEVSAVEWHDISDLPRKSYAVLPFVGQLKRWIRRRQKGKGGGGNNRQQTPAKKRNDGNKGGARSANSTPKRDRSNKRGGEQQQGQQGARSANSTPKRDRSNKRGGGQGQQKSDPSSSAANTPSSTSSKSKQRQGKDGGGGCGGNSRSGSRSGSRGRKDRPGSRGRDRDRAVVREGDAVARTLLAEPGEEAGWSEADMFATNELMLGRKVEYDGNPHEFTGDDGMEIDPHRFRVVGGTLLNSGGGGAGGGVGTIGSSAPPPETSRLQPLFARSAGEREGESGGGDGGGVVGEGELEPFFSDGGRAPWETSSAPSSAAAAAPGPQRMERGATPPILGGSPLLGGSNDPGMEILKLLRRSSGADAPSSAAAALDADGVFLTDAEITARSQLEKTGAIPPSAAAGTKEKEGGNDDLEYMKKWVGGLIRTSPSAAAVLFGEEEFRFDMGPILSAMKVGTMQV